MKNIFSKKFASLFFFCSFALTITNTATAAPKPLWKAGLYGGGTPSNASPTTTSVLFEILNDKKIVKGFGGFFPITCYYDDGLVATKSENISRATSPTFTLSRHDRTQRKDFNYTDDFGVVWDVAVSFKWIRANQAFRVHLSVLIPREQLGDNFCKTDLRLANKAVKLRTAR